MFSLRTKILTIVLVFLMFFGVAFVFYSMGTTVNYKSLRLNAIEKTVAFETEIINKTIVTIGRSAVSLAHDGLLFQKSQSAYIAETSALEYLRSFPSAVGCGFWFEPYAYNENDLRAGVYAYLDYENNSASLDESFTMADYDYHSLSWYHEIIGEIERPYQVIWTKPYVDDTLYSYMTTAGAGIFDEFGNLLGISIIDWEIEEMIEEISTVKPTKNSFVLLCTPEQDNIIFCSQEKSLIGESMKALSWDINADIFVLDGIEYYRFGRFMDNGWLLSVQIPENEIFEEIEDRNIRFSAITVFLSIMMLCLAYFLISKLINNPIKKLTQDVAQIALGNLDVHVEISSKDELGLLARTFNKMTSDLKESIEAYTLEHTEKERIGAELSIAAGIQATMLPYIFPPFPDRTEFDIFASMLPAKEVGGDFYDFFLIDENNLAVVIADVSGKGVPAALLMAITKTIMKNSACTGKSPGKVFETVNNLLCENNNAGVFVTAFMGYYNTASGKFVYVNAGHSPPFIKKAGKDYELLKTKPCLVLACIEDVDYYEEEIILEKGDTIFLYTDGVTEAMNPDRVLFSEQNLFNTLKKNRDCPPLDLLSAVKTEIDIFAEGAGQADDITMLALRIDHLTEKCMKELIVEASTESLDEVIDFVNMELARYNCPNSLQTYMNLAAEEIFINIARYAYTASGGSVSICIGSEGNNVVIMFEDSGKPFNPLEQPPPDMIKLLREQETSHLGIFLVTKIMDKVDYTRKDDKNIFTMVKKIR